MHNSSKCDKTNNYYGEYHLALLHAGNTTLLLFFNYYYVF